MALATLKNTAKNTARKAAKKEFYLGGYDAKSCQTLVMKNHHPSYTASDQDDIPPGDLARMEDGVRFESEVSNLWAAALGDRFLAIPACDRSDASKRTREKLTLAAMENPGNARVIWNARLPKLKKSNRTGEPDALVHWGVDASGTHLWVPVDVKHHKSIKGERSNRGGLPVSSFADPFHQSATMVDLGDGTPQQNDALQLAHYFRMLNELGHAAPVAVGGIVGKELQILWHQLDEKVYDRRSKSALEIYDSAFADAVKIASSAIDGVATVEPEWKDECKSCVWRTSCHDELKVDLDHITLVPGVTPSKAKAHYAAGVRRISDLARRDWRTATLIDGKVDVRALKAWALAVPAETSVLDFPGDTNYARQAGSFGAAKVRTAGDVLALDEETMAYNGLGSVGLAKSIDNARAQKIGKVFLGRGVTSVGINRSVYEQDVDIEDENGFVYLIGVRTTGRKLTSGQTETERKRGEGRFEYDAFVNWEQSSDGEAKVFADFWKHIQESREYASRRKYAYRLYHYSSHEPIAFKKLAVRHAGKPGVPTLDDVEEFFNLKEVIDLYEVLVEQLVWPTESVSLKEVAKWVRFSWRDSDPGGGNSLAWYKDAVSHPDESVREENRQRLLEYNEDDVTAQVAIRDWLTRLGEARLPGKKLPEIATLDRRFSRR